MSSTREVTGLLRALSSGDGAAEDELAPMVYNELRRLGASCMRSERAAYKLQATSFVHEADLKLVNQKENWRDRSNFYGVAPHQMRGIPVDYARKDNVSKRCGRERWVSFEDALATAAERPSDLLGIEESLGRIAREHPRQVRVFELGFHGGYTEEDAAKILGVSFETVKWDWRLARAWLSREIRLTK